MQIDVVGDIHGQLAPLLRLGRRLGYAVDGDWSHPHGRRLLFVGDLIDRGPHSLEVAMLVRQLVAEGRALCLLGNHEYNLVQWRHGRSKPKSSNRPTIAAVERDPEAWAPALEFFERLPVAVELPDLRVTHAVWYRPAFERLRPTLAVPAGDFCPSPDWDGIIALHSVYEGGRLRAGLPTEPIDGQDGTALEVFIKGFETVAQAPFRDNDGALRRRMRAMWWTGKADVPRDRRLVFGHYWNMPVVSGVHDDFWPPYPSGHPDLRDWFESNHDAVPDEGTVAVPEGVTAVCIDFNGVTRAGRRACVGAYRYPESQVVWASSEL